MQEVQAIFPLPLLFRMLGSLTHLDFCVSKSHSTFEIPTASHPLTTLPIVSSARLGKHVIYISLATRFLRRRSPGHVRPVHRCTRRCPAPCQARLVRGMGQREVSASGGFGASQGPRPLAGGAKRGIGRGRLWLQPYDLGPDSASPQPATGPLTGAPRRRCLGDGHHRGRQKRKQWPNRK